MPGMILPDLQALPQHFQLAEKVGHRALPDCHLIQQVYCKLKETAVQSQREARCYGIFLVFSPHTRG